MPTVETLIGREKLPISYQTIVGKFWSPLAERMAEWRRASPGPLIVGVNGGQGSGKTTLCRFLEERLLPEHGLRAVTVPLDDFYFPKAQRNSLAAAVHPLFAVRGVPGTHNVALLKEALSRLKNGDGAVIPKFDKAADDSAPEREWRRIAGPADIILFEGWCVGAAPQRSEDLNEPVNALEMREDPEGVWRRRANAALSSDYRELFTLIDRLVMLRAPDMEMILRNRLEQERKLRDANPGGANVMSDDEVARFVQFYERLTRSMFAEMPARADVVFDLSVIQAAH